MLGGTLEDEPGWDADRAIRTIALSTSRERCLKERESILLEERINEEEFRKM
jgi:hypothetical protein